MLTLLRLPLFPISEPANGVRYASADAPYLANAIRTERRRRTTTAPAATDLEARLCRVIRRSHIPSSRRRGVCRVARCLLQLSKNSQPPYVTAARTSWSCATGSSSISAFPALLGLGPSCFDPVARLVSTDLRHVSTADELQVVKESIPDSGFQVFFALKERSGSTFKFCP